MAGTDSTVYLEPPPLLLQITTSIAESIINKSSSTVHASFYPFAIFSTLHAVRVAWVYNARCKAARRGKALRPVNLRVDIAGFLLMAWGGNFLVFPILGLIPPPMLSILPLTNYLTVFFLLRYLPQPSPWLLDTVLPILDALTRSMSVTSALIFSQNHINPLVKESNFLQFILGALATSGGGMLATTLDVFSGEWKLTTPPIFARDVWANWDLIAGILGTALFSFCTSPNSSWASVRNGVYPPHVSPFGMHPTPPYTRETQRVRRVMGTLPVGEARVLVMLLFTVLYGFKAYMLHWHKAVKEFVNEVPTQGQVEPPIASEKKLKVKKTQ